MKIIPVLDLFDGLVVHAVKGKRENYKPIDSKLCGSPDPIQIIQCLLSHYNFSCIYVADLDALESFGDNKEIIKSIIKTFPKLEIWLDTGDNLINYYLDTHANDKIRVILSTESIKSYSNYCNYLKSYPLHHFILSLDYISGEILGPGELVSSESRWPRDVLILNLDRVGSNKGIRFPRQIDNKSLTKKFNLYYGGGIRDLNDLRDLKSISAAGALLSTALHKQSILKTDLDLIK